MNKPIIKPWALNWSFIAKQQKPQGFVSHMQCENAGLSVWIGRCRVSWNNRNQINRPRRWLLGLWFTWPLLVLSVQTSLWGEIDNNPKNNRRALCVSIWGVARWVGLAGYMVDGTASTSSCHICEKLWPETNSVILVNKSFYKSWTQPCQ